MQLQSDLPPPSGDLLVRLGSVVAALAKLNVKVSTEELLKAIHEEEANHAKSTVEPIQKRKSALPIPDGQSVQQTQLLSTIPLPSTPIPLSPILPVGRQ